MRRLLNTLLVLPALLLCMAFAQTAMPLPDGLDAYSAAIALFVGLLSGLLVHPLTAIAKRFGRTEGPTTVAISAVLSLLVSAGYALYQAAASHPGPGLWGALLNAAIAFVFANGLYLGQVSAAAKGAAIALPQIAGKTSGPE